MAPGVVGRAVPGQPRIRRQTQARQAPQRRQHLKPLLVEAAWAAVRTDTRLAARYRRLVLRFGGYRSPAAKKKAIIAVAHTLLVIVWHVLTTGNTYTDLGPDYYTHRLDPEKETQRLIAKLQALGHTVTLQPAA